MDPPQMIGMDFGGRGDGYFRILAGTSVKYITIKEDTLNEETLDDMPLDFQDILPLPYHGDDWNRVYVSRNSASGELDFKLSKDELPGVQTIWHPEMVNFLDLERAEPLSLLAQESVFKRDSERGQGPAEGEKKEATRMISKMARFDWEIRYMEAETRIYKLLQPLEAEGAGIAPRFLGYIHESGRVIGFLLEKVEGRRAGPEDLAICEAALRKLHGLGITHGDCNRHNFIVGADGKVTLIDFDGAAVGADAKAMAAEIASLPEQLREETGRGGGYAYAETVEE